MSRAGRSAARAVAGLVVVASCVATTAARAFDAEMTSTTAAQAYSLRTFGGDATLLRRRFTQTLGLEIAGIGDEAARGGAEIVARVRVRLDTDFGVAPDEVRYSPVASRFVPGLSDGALDVMYAYVEGRRLAGGVLGFKLGRQYLVDSLGFWSMDGASLRAEARSWARAEIYGGFEQRGGLPFSTPRFERAGVARGDRTGFDTGVYPGYQRAASAPAVGASIETTGLAWLHARADWRKVWNRGETVLDDVPDPATGALVRGTGTRVSSERFGASVTATHPRLGWVQAGLVYDFYASLVSSRFASVDVFALDRLSLGAEWDQFVPTFDGDSIFGAFARSPSRTITGRARFEASRRLEVATSGGVRTYFTQGDPSTWQAEASRAIAGAGPAPSRDPSALDDLLGDVSARLRLDASTIGARALVESGGRAHREGGDVFGERRFVGDRWLATARGSVYRFGDAERPERDATSFGYVVGLGFRPDRHANVLVEWEHDVNRLVGQRYRVVALVDLLVTK